LVSIRARKILALLDQRLLAMTRYKDIIVTV
jgi:hypothetical protein